MMNQTSKESIRAHKVSPPSSAWENINGLLDKQAFAEKQRRARLKQRVFSFASAAIFLGLVYVVVTESKAQVQFPQGQIAQWEELDLSHSSEFYDLTKLRTLDQAYLKGGLGR